MTINLKLPNNFFDWVVKFEESRLIPDLKKLHEKIFTELVRYMIPEHSTSFDTAIKKVSECGGWMVEIPSSVLFDGTNFTDQYKELLVNEIIKLNPHWEMSWRESGVEQTLVVKGQQRSK